MKRMGSTLSLLGLGLAVAIGMAHADVPALAPSTPSATTTKPSAHSPDAANVTDSSAESGDLSLKKAAPLPADDAWRAALPNDPVAATEAYMSRLPRVAVDRANAYFEGAYWLKLWNLLIELTIAVLLLRSKISARARAKIDGLTKNRAARLIAYAAAYMLLIWVVTLPWSIYTDYFREHQYGLLNQTFLPWFREQLIGLALSVVLGSLVIAALYAVMKRLPRTWHAWATVLMVVIFSLQIAVAPVFISPLFNKYSSLEPGPLRETLLSMARANGVPATDIFQFDASKQSDRVSANVSGFLGTTRISLNDNLLRRSSVPEIKAVIGHEMGHYVLHHILKMIVDMIVITAIVFFVIKITQEKLVARYGRRDWQIEDPYDVASLPLFMAILTVAFFLLTPITNSLVRQQEAEADLFGINASREPDGEAEVDLKLTEYRKPDPGTWEEIIFFDHPSTRARIFMAMAWKAENRK